MMIETGISTNEDSLLEGSLSSIDIAQDDFCLQQTDQKSFEKQVQQLKSENDVLRSLLQQLLLEIDQQFGQIDRQQLEIECLREQRELLLRGPSIKLPARQRIRDCFGAELETIGELEPLRMYVVNGRFRFEEMRRRKRNEEMNRKISGRRYYM